MAGNFADSLTVTIVDDNSVDFLIGGDPCVERYDLPLQFSHRRTPVQAEFGISFHVSVERAGRTYNVLFDTGLTGEVLLHNFRALGLDPTQLDHIVISHGHPDHYGGLEDILRAAGGNVPVCTHPHAFEPRYAVMPSGHVAPNYNLPMNRQRLEAAGAGLVETKSPLPVAPGVYTTGEIPRTNDFEGPREPVSFPGLYQVIDGVCAGDSIMDEMAMVVHVRDAGLVVLTGCGHAGVINTLDRAIALTGEPRILAVMGGFHLGFPGTPERNVDLTVEALSRLQVRRVVPMHCTGLRATSAMAVQLPDAFLQPSVGTVLRFGPATE